MKILLAEDDLPLVEELRPRLQRAGYACEWADNGVDAEFLASEESFDAIILDLGLPQKPGLEVLKALRSQQNSTPVLILTARDTWQERVEGLKSGADDYLGKPFQFEELVARLEALLRRKFGHSEQVLSFADITLDLDRQTVSRDGQSSVQLTAIEFRLLRYLMSNADRIISKTELSEHVYEEEQLRDSNVIEVYINRLRTLLGKEAIKTFRGQGYRLMQTSVR